MGGDWTRTCHEAECCRHVAAVKQGTGGVGVNCFLQHPAPDGVEIDGGDGVTSSQRGALQSRSLRCHEVHNMSAVG